MSDPRMLTQLLAETGRHPTLVDKRDLFDLVFWAYRHDEISISKASELIGLPISVMQVVLTVMESKAEKP